MIRINSYSFSLSQYIYIYIYINIYIYIYIYIYRQTHRQTDREFNYRGHSYPLWIVGGSGPIVTNLQPNFISTSFRVSKPVAGFVVVLTLFQKGYRCNSYLYRDSIASINIYERMY